NLYEFTELQIKCRKILLAFKMKTTLTVAGHRLPYCITAKDVMSKYKFKPGHLELIDITEWSDMGSLQDYFLELTRARTVPQVFIGEECVGGGSDGPTVIGTLQF
uniref:Glutaredoxin (thioltransferase) n=1 Tax=Acanthochromis polyacanthus TaxID=80966 RepID=A0A3Q1F0D9_9TELE